MTAEESMFQEALAAIDNRERARARDLLTRLLKIEPNNGDFWLWMSAVVDTPKERSYCLKEVLRIDPNSPAARRGLMALGGLPPDPSLAIPFSVQKRKWQSGKDKLPDAAAARPLWKPVVLYGGAAALVVVLVIIAIVGVNNARKRVVYSAPISYQPVLEITVTPSPQPTATPLPPGPTPPWAALAVPYTATSVYVNTPHPRAEAFGIGLRALQQQELEKALMYLKQAASGDPSAADIPYRIGEVYGMLGQHDKALAAYEQSLNIDQDFAPGYLGRARALRMTTPDDFDQPKTDLETALRLDPNLFEAHLLLADVYLAWQQPEPALEQVDQAGMLLPDSPLVPYYRALVSLQNGELDAALDSVNHALESDLGLLPAYRLKGQILQAAGDAPASLEPLEIYARYASAEDADTLVLMGNAYAANGLNEQALQAFSRALELDRTQTGILLQRGNLYLALSDGQSALVDFNASLAQQPRSFASNLGKARAYLLLEQYGKAYQQLNRTLSYAETDEDTAQVLYYRALSLEPSNPPVAVLDWQALLELPSEALPTGWEEQARQHIEALATRTPTATKTKTAATPTATKTHAAVTSTARAKTPSPTPTAR